MAVRFSSTPSTFARKNVALTQMPTDEALDKMLQCHTARGIYQFHTADRELLLNVTRCFGLHLRYTLAK